MAIVGSEFYRAQIYQGLEQSGRLLPEMDLPPVEAVTEVSGAIQTLQKSLGQVTLGPTRDLGIDVSRTGSDYKVEFDDSTSRAGVADELRVSPENQRRLFQARLRDPITDVTMSATLNAKGLWVYGENGRPVKSGKVETMAGLNKTPAASILYASNAVLHVARMVDMVPV